MVNPGAPSSNGFARLDGRVAVVTGGSSGIGRQVCLALAREGSRVVVVGRDADRIARVVADIEQWGRQAAGLALDVSREDDMEEMRRLTLERFGAIDALVASAGIANAGGQRRVPATVASTTVDDWDRVLDTNLTGVFLSNRAVLPAMMEQGSGVIVNVGSARAGVRGSAYASAYCASKFGVVGLSRVLADEVKDHGIKVYAVLPDLVSTPMLGPLGARLGATLDPARVADCIVELLAMPEDTVLVDPLIAPFAVAERLAGAQA